MFEEVQDPKAAGLDDYWAIVRRRRWWILLPLSVCWLVVWVVSWLLPATFQSDALILVEQQKVPEQYVVPNVSVSLQERLQSMTQQILSRTRLQATIDRFHLYARDGGLLSKWQATDPVDQSGGAYGLQDSILHRLAGARAASKQRTDHAVHRRKS